MPKKGKKKVQTMGDDLEVEIITKMEIIYEDTKAFIGVEPVFRWGHIYLMIKDQANQDTGLEDIPICANIRKSTIMKVSTHPELFPFVEVIDWISNSRQKTKNNLIFLLSVIKHRFCKRKQIRCN